MFLIQLFLPIYDPDGVKFDSPLFENVKKELLKVFEGVTFYHHAPAQGLWKDEEGHVDHDRMITVEVMTEDLDRGWWKQYKESLEKIFRQKEIMVRVINMEKI